MLKRLWILLLILVVTVYMGVAYLESFPTILVGIELMFALLSLFYVLLSAWGLRVAFASPKDTITVGKKGELRARIKNRLVFPVFYGEIMIELTYFQSSERLKLRLPFTSLPGRVSLMHLPITVRYAGTLRIEPRYIYVYDFLHLFSVKRRLKSKAASMTVLPEFQQIFVRDRSSRFFMPLAEDKRTEDDARNNIQRFYRDRVGDDPSEVFQVRDYRIGDRLSRVDWKLTAKSQKLMVKDYSFPIIDRTVILVDMHCDNQMSYHQRVHTAVALCISILEANCSMTLAWYDVHRQMVVQRHLEKDEDLFESIGMLTAAAYCRKILPSEIISQLSLACQIEQLLYITGSVDENEMAQLESLEQVKRTRIYSIENRDMHTEQLSESLYYHVLPVKGLQEALGQLHLELY